MQPFLLCVVFLHLSLLSALDDHRAETVRPGQDVPLQCQGPGGEVVTLLEWSRSDLKEDGYVFFYRNSRSYENYQHSSFRGRVQLRDLSMKDGDVSVVLQNANLNDSGVYECRVISSTESGGRSQVSCSVHVTVMETTTVTSTVTSSGETGGLQEKDGRDKGTNGDTSLLVVVVVPVVLLVVVVVVCVVVCVVCVRRHSRSPKYNLSAETEKA
ncbi:nectin-4-like isoform X2 [Parambassis ranga]|uniref:Nectin-4-like isoform X2 n=1 Tax=Parambassis ranga TaxID=210632 RepID=A0A6P7IAI5_9TELE|nr:nectin-4-like isoform X2 [Parambassis ranga]